MESLLEKLMIGRYENIQNRYAFLIQAFDKKELSLRRILTRGSGPSRRKSRKRAPVSRRGGYSKGTAVRKRALLAY